MGEIWKGRYLKILKALHEKKTDKGILLAIHEVIDEANGYNYHHISISAKREIENIFKEQKSGAKKCKKKK
jgi:hypothetical protein